MKIFLIEVCLVLISFHPLLYSQTKYRLPDGTLLDSVDQISAQLPIGMRTIAGVILDKSTFKDVQAFLGPAESPLRSDDPHEADIIGYRAYQDTNVFLVFAAGWPENPTDKLTSFTLCMKNVLPPEYRNCNCARTTKLSATIATPSGIKLGLNQVQVRSILGVPNRLTSHWMIYALQSYHEYSNDEQKRYGEAPGGGYYKGEYTYHDVVLHFSNRGLDLIQVSVGGESDW